MLLNEIFGFGRKKEQARRGKTLGTAGEVVEQFEQGRLNRDEAEKAIARLARNKEEYSAVMAELMFAGA